MKQLTSAVFTLFAILLSAQTSFAKVSAKKIQWMSPDFFVEQGMRPGQGRQLEIDGSADCRAGIAVKTCLVDPPTSPNDQNRTCLDGSRGYAKPFEDVYDHLPPTFQKMFCSLKVIYIEKKLGATAYAGLTKNGAVMGVRQSVLDEGLQFARWATWKEQLAFGGSQSSFDPIAGLPFYVTPVLPELNSFLYQLLVHEFGHQFDFANGLNAYAPGCPAATPENPEPECEFKEGTWGSLSWKTNFKPLPENDFANRDAFCFYSCGGNTSPLSMVPQLYADLYASAFINAYASNQTWDDFADSLAYYAISTYLHTSIQLDTAQGQVYNLTDKLHSERFSKKLNFIETFLAKPDIKYP